MGTFTQFIILISVLAAMVMVLLAIRHLTHYEDFEDTDQTTGLKEEMEDTDEVLSENNIFHKLMHEEKKIKSAKEKTYNSNSRDPFSRKE